MPSTSFESPVLKENNLNSLNYNHKSKNNGKKRSAESIVDNEDSDVEELSESQVSLEDLENVKNFYSQGEKSIILYSKFLIFKRNLLYKLSLKLFTHCKE